jgi:hypothetical protein
MTGCCTAFSELDERHTGSVRFSDVCRVQIRERGTVLFRCKDGKHRALTDMYFIPELRSSIVSLGQMDKHEAEVLIRDGVLRIKDHDGCSPGCRVLVPTKMTEYETEKDSLNYIWAYRMGRDIHLTSYNHMALPCLTL